ncbi:MAG: carboxypeptidase regulatory-like domain-containing protein [Candidatus Pacearchaeota archaeon]|nr:MAG: carboxypeptidase regulatory-like domain-containing protein [Candidatus Pacearchaeota archaeon]
MRIKKEVLVLVFLVSILFLSSAVKTDIFMGTCEGFVFYLNGTKVTGANVTVSVDGCTTPPENCVRSALTDLGGYYVIANLNLQPYGNVSVTAKKGTFYRTNTGQADAYQAAFVNVTLCEAPTSPSLVPVPDSHYPNITFWFNWSSGTSPYATFDQWNFDNSGWITATSPQSKTNLAFKNYTWSVKTCLSSLPSCCSPPSTDTFSVYNTPPCVPILTPQPDTYSNTVTLNWTSNTTAPCPDADNDITYYNFRIDGNLTTHATPPMIISGLGYGSHIWQVQECDLWECSAWASDTFNIGNNPCPSPNLTNQSDTCVNQVTLKWTSANIDGEGDACHDEFYFHGTTQSPASSPQTLILTDQALYTWRVRTCDNYSACSDWVEDSFIFCTCPPLIEEVEGERRGYVGGCRLPAGYEIVFSVPRDVYPGEHFKIDVGFKYFLSITDLIIETESPEGIEVETLNYCPVSGNTNMNLKLEGRVPVDFREGTYYLFVKGYDSKKLLFNKPIELKVVSPPTTIVSLLRLPYLPCCIILLILIILILAAASIWAGKEVYKRMKEKGEKRTKMLKKIKEGI